MDTFQLRYDVRPGTVNLGTDYEFKTIALLALRCVLHGVDDMWIASNVNGVGAADDIVLHVKTSENERTTFMMQLKHKNNLNNIQDKEFLNPKGDFSLKKCSKDISNLQQSISSNSNVKLVKHLGPFENIYFLFFTNRGVYENSEMLVDRNCPDKSISFLKNVLNTNTTVSSLFSFKLDKLPDIAANNNFNNVFLLANQLSLQHLDREIANRIMDIVNPAAVAQVDIKGMAQNFMQYVKDWARETGGRYCLTKQEVLSKISELFFAQYAVNLRQHQFTFYDDDKKSMWNQIMRHETITVVESNNVVLEFLGMYIGSEVKKYCDVSNYKFWSDNLSRQSLFPETNKHFKEQMLKIGNFGEITLVDVYKCLWILKKLPLLLEVKRIEEYESILHVLKFTNYSYKVIIINNSTWNLPCKEIGTRIFCTLQDLPSDYKEAILSLPIKLQSRAGVVLGNVIDESMLNYIKCNDVINILLNNFNIGNTLNQLPSYFIERSFLKTFIKAQAVRELNKDIFILDNRSNLYFSLFPQNDFNACKLEDIDFDILNNYKAILQENDEPELIKKIKSAGKTVHYLSMHDQNSFQWKWSSGSTRNIKPYQIQGKEDYEKDIEPCFSNAVNIISDTAGMGKSTLMDFVQHKAPTNKWVIRVNLNNHQEYFRGCKYSNIDACKDLRYFNDIMLNEQSPSSKLSQMIFEKLLITKDIIVILDGFDEVSFSHEDRVLKIAKSLYLEGYHIWLTTRPHMQSDLEEKFKTFSINLNPFSEEDQHQFLTKIFSLVNSELILGSEFLLKTFVEKLLGAARKNLSDLDAKFTGIPLQGKLLADVFNEDCRNYLLSKGTTCFNETFDLVYLYQNFIDKKIEILCNKFGSCYIDLHNMFKRHQTLFALKLIYPHHTFIRNYVRELDEYKREPEKIQLLQRDGIITVDEEQNIKCVHRTFAEFLVATWLSNNFNCKQKHIKEFVHSIINGQFKSLFHQNDARFCSNMFHRLVAHDNCPAHLAIMNRQIGKVNEIISSNNSSAIEVLDRSGRSILHTICIHGVSFPLYTADDIVYHNGDLVRHDFEIQNFESDDMLAILKIIPDATIRKLAKQKDVLGYNPLDYALLHHSFAIANHICSKIDAITINACLLSYLYNRLCSAFCVQYNFLSLFKIFLPYLACGDLLMNVVDLKVDVLCHLSNCYSINVKDNHFLHSYKKITLSQVMQSESSYPYSGFTNDHYSDLRFAAAFGTKQNVLKVLPLGIDIDINRLDHNRYAPLHYGVLHGNSETIEALVLNDANINMQGHDGNTPLHIAVMEYSKKIIPPARSPIVRANNSEVVSNKYYHNIDLLLLSKDIDVNKQNSFGETPLRVLVGGWRKIRGYMRDKHIPTWYSSNIMDLVKLLISNGANVNTDKQHGVPILHFACEMNFVEFVIEYLSKIDDINIPDRNGRTALHLAVLNECYDLVKILLLIEADINKQDHSGCTPLHFATTGEMATLLITEGANIHLETEDGETALHRQASCGRAEIVNELLQKDLDVNKQINNGDTALHLTVKNISVEATFEHELTIDLLLRNGADVNIKNRSELTPLDFASNGPLWDKMKLIS